MTRRLKHLIGAGLLAGALATLSFVPPALALESLGQHRDWTVLKHEEGENVLCYIASRPTREQGEYSARDEVHILVTHRPYLNTRDVVSILAGYTYKEDSVVEAQIGNTNFAFYPSGEYAFSRNPEDDRRLVAAMKAGVEMIVTGTSDRGTETTDTYSLRGFTAAYDQSIEACGL
ncbi:MAG: invasion associated locus B family protein [Pseudomonadota bacterium]